MPSPTNFYTFPDEATAKALLPDELDEDGNWIKRNVDVIGIAYNNDGTYDEEGNVVTEPTQKDGWRMNTIGSFAPSNLEDYRVTPATPDRVYL